MRHLKHFSLFESVESTPFKSIVESARKQLDKSAPLAYYGFYYSDKEFTPKEVEQELKKDGIKYDPKYPIAEAPDHPLHSTCRGSAYSLAGKLRSAGYDARVIAGWYTQSGPGYYVEATMTMSMPPDVLRGKDNEEHWWVDCDGYYVDITSDQFHPHDPERQLENRIVIEKKKDAFINHYYPVKRQFIGSKATLDGPLKELAEKMTVKLAKTSIERKNAQKIREWIDKHAKGLTDIQKADLKAQAEEACYSSEKYTYEDMVREIA